MFALSWSAESFMLTILLVQHFLHFDLQASTTGCTDEMDTWDSLLQQ